MCPTASGSREGPSPRSARLSWLRRSRPFERSFLTPRFHLAVILVLAALMLFPKLGGGDLRGWDDAFYAHEGRQMLESGDWWNVRFNGYLNFEYPPMFIWMEAASMRLFGVSDFAARAPAALAGFLTILVVFLLARELSGGLWSPIWAAWILLFTLPFVQFSQRAMTDVPFTLFFVAAVFFYVKSWRDPSFFLPAGAAIACAILTRSALGLLPAGLILVHEVMMRRVRKPRTPYVAACMSIGLLVPGIWYGSQYLLHGEAFLIGHFGFLASKLTGVEAAARHWERTAALAARESNPVSLSEFLVGLSYYPRVLLDTYWPWLPFALLGLRDRLRDAMKRDERAVLLVLWLVAVMGPFSVAAFQRPRYIMAVYPALAIVAAGPISIWISRMRSRTQVYVSWLIPGIVALGIAVFANHLDRAVEMRSVAAGLASTAGDRQRVVFYHVNDDASQPTDLVTQLLWYSNRLLEWRFSPDDFLERLEEGGNFVVDRATFERVVVPSGVALELLFETTDHIGIRVL